MIDTEHVVQRFLKYVSFDTQSDEDNDAVCPSTPGQLVFAKALAEELKAIGLSDVTLDEHGYIMATLPANGAEGPVVGFISHVDTSPDASGKDIKPVRVTDYDGKDVVLNEAAHIVADEVDLLRADTKLAAQVLPRGAIVKDAVN